MSFSQPPSFSGFCGSDVPVPILDDTEISRPVHLRRPETPTGACPTDPPPILPVLPPNGCIHRISTETMADLLSGCYDGMFQSLHIVDCRYPYEFEGGHINGAVNFTDPRQFVAEFFVTPKPGALIIFHCEFSHNRGPQMAMHFRNYDRDANRMQYPAIHYPQVYLLDGGYRAFYRAHPGHCNGSYVSMLDDAHRLNGDLSRATIRYREAFESFNDSPRRALRPARNVLHTSLRSPKQSQIPVDDSPTKLAMFRTSPLRRMGPLFE